MEEVAAQAAVEAGRRGSVRSGERFACKVLASSALATLLELQVLSVGPRRRLFIRQLEFPWSSVEE